MMKARSGRIINITSVVGHAGNPDRPTTVPRKPAFPGLTCSLARELGSRNITVNCRTGLHRYRHDQGAR